MSTYTGPFLVVVPALNEAETVASVVTDVSKAYPLASILVVDDGSTDATSEEARSAGAVVAKHASNLGVGAAMRTGFRYAQVIGATTVIQVDADGQHDVKQIGTLIEALGGADVVVGSRFLGSGDYAISRTRRMTIGLLSRAVSVPCRTRITDATSGFRATGHRGIPLFARYYPTEYLADTVESLALAGRAGLSVTEVPVVMRPRQGGNPSQGFVSGVLNLARSAFVALQSMILRLPPGAHELVEAA